MTAVIADTSPLLRKIPSDPIVDSRSFGFSPSPMSFARYLAEGRQQQQRDRQSPSPRSYRAEQTPSPYSRGYGYSYTESFAYEDEDESGHVSRSACHCTMRCTCGAGMPDAPSGSWRKDRTRPGLIHGEESPSGPGKTAGSGRVATITPGATRSANGTKSGNSKNSDWEKLLGAVDLELRMQQRGGNQAEGSTMRPGGVGAYCSSVNQGVGGNCHGHMQSTAISSMEMEPKAKHHRRGGEGATGGDPAYSGSTADAACLLATLPQRMLEPAIPAHSGVDVDGNGDSPLVSAVASPAPVRVQASGRRGPRGQSRFKGVCITRAGKWRAVIYIGRKQKYLGVFDSEYDAARAYDAAAVQHFAEGAKLNFPEGMEQHLQAAAAAATASMKAPQSQAPLDVCGSGGPAAPRSATPPPFESPSRKRSRKRAFGDGLDDDDEWVRDDVPWSTRR